MQFGHIKTSKANETGSGISVVESFRDGKLYRTVKQYRIRIKVTNTEEEMHEFIIFTESIRKLRESGLISIDSRDPSTYPAFIIDYPPKDLNGSYFIVKCWSELI